jgi:hypothetical protein
MNMFISNLGNSKAGVIDTIKTAERIHWTLGLKQAENTVFAQSATLRSNIWNNRKLGRDVCLKREKVSWLKKIWYFCRFIPILGNSIRNNIETLLDEIAAWEEGDLVRESLFRDCAYELKIAQEELHRILQEHPEIESLSYEELQEYSLVALKEKKLSYLSPRYWSAKNGLPETVGVTLFEVSDDERDYLITRIAQKMYNLPATEETIRLAGIFSQLPPHEKEILLQNTKAG